MEQSNNLGELEPDQRYFARGLHESGSWNHQAYWGPNNTGWGPPAYQVSNSVPTSGTRVRLEVPASAVGLEGHTLNGMAFTLAGGRATWDNAGKSH